MTAFQVEVAPARMPGHHDLAPVNSIIFQAFHILRDM